MPHKKNSEPESPLPSLSNSASSLFDKDALKVRRTSLSLSNLSPGKSKSKRQSISVQDLMGGEKKATDIHSPDGSGSGSQRLSRRSIMSVESAPPVIQAEDKIQNILKARKTRQRRRSDICKSLEMSAEFLNENAPPSSFSDLPDDMENLTIPLNDVIDSPEGAEKEEGRRRRRNSGNKSPSRIKRSDVTREQRLRMVRSLESKEKPLTPKKDGNKFLTNASAFSPKSPNMKRSGSVNSLRDRLRLRLQGAKYCDLDESTSDMSDVEIAPTRARRKSIGVISDDECTGDESDICKESKVKKRSKSKSKERRARSKSRNRISKKQAEAGEDPDSTKNRKSRSKSRNSVRSKSARRRIRKEDISTETEDNTSNTSFSIDNSRSNVAASGRRGGRRPSQHNTDNDYTVVSDENTDAEASFEFQTQSSSKNSFNRKSRSPSASRSQNGKSKPMDLSNSSTESLVVSPGSKKPKKRTKTKKSSHKDEELSLGSHLESERNSRTLDKDDLSQVTEEQSNSSSQGQPILLQFDPTSDNHVQSVNQEKAKKNSGTIHGSNGTKSRLEIAELGGLPTFEKLNGSGNTGTTESSRRSLDSSTSSHDHSRSFFSTPNVVPKGMSRASSYIPPSPQMVQTPGETTFEDGGQNAQWGDFGDSHSSRQNRSAAKNMFFNKKGKEGEKFQKAARRSSDIGIGARTSSFGAIRLLGGRHKLRDYDDSMGDGECLLNH